MQDRSFSVGLDRESAERVFVKAVAAVGTSLADVNTAITALATFEASLCPSCGCYREDHLTPFEDDPRHGSADWVCYDCGRDEECPR